MASTVAARSALRSFICSLLVLPAPVARVGLVSRAYALAITKPYRTNVPKARGGKGFRAQCCCGATASAVTPQAALAGGREQESNLPGAAEQPQPALKAGRPTGAASLPSRSIGRPT